MTQRVQADRVQVDWAQAERGIMDVEEFVQYGTVKRDECNLQ